MKICGACGSRGHEDEARFCWHCGSPLGSAEGPANELGGAEVEDQIESERAVRYDEVDSHQEYRKAVSQALSDGIVDEERDRRTLEETRRKLRLSEGEALELEDEILTGQARRPESGQKSEPMRWPVRLEINDNQFFMERMVGGVDFRVHNHSDKPVRGVCLSIASSYFASAEKDFPKIGPGDHARYRLAVVPSLAGQPPVDLELAYEQDGEVSVLTAQAVYRVMAKNAVPANIKVEIDQSVHAEAGSKLGFGLSMRNEVDEVFKSGLIQNINDLIARDFPDHWTPVRLVYDEEATKRRREKRPSAIQVVAALKDRRCAMSKGALTGADGPEAKRALLLGVDPVRLGRSRANDIVLRVMPRSEENDVLSKQITASKPHCVLSLKPEGLFLADQDTLNGTEVDGSAWEGAGPLPLDRPSEVDVAKALRLRLVPFLEGRGCTALRADLYSELGRPDDLWRAAEQLRLRSLLVQRVENLADEERYLIVFRYANIGRGMGNELIVPGEGLERTHARIVRLGGQFWLESFVEGDRLMADGVPIPSGRAAPLAPGMVLQYGDLSGRFERFQQIGL